MNVAAAIAFVAHRAPFINRDRSVSLSLSSISKSDRGQLVLTTAPATTPYDLHSTCAHLTAAS